MGKTRQELSEWALWVLNSKWLYAWGCYGQRLQAIYNTLATSRYYTIVNPEGFKRLTVLYNAGANPRLYDCHGIVDGFRMDDGSTAEVEFDPSLDVSADYEMAKVKATGTLGKDYGPIDANMKDNAGYGYWKTGHFGVGVGDGLVVDIWSTGNPARIRDQTLGSWTNWLKCYDIDYSGGESMLIDYGQKNDGVGLWQVDLVVLGYNIGTSGPAGDGIDESYGDKTKAATLDFKAKNNLPATTIVDETVFAAAKKALRAPIVENVALKKKIVELETEITELNAELLSTNDALKEANQDVLDLTAQVNSLTAQVNDLTTKLAVANNKIIDLGRQINALNLKITEQNAEIIRLKAIETEFNVVKAALAVTNKY